MKAADKEEVSEDVEDAGDGNRDKRRIGVPEAAEDAADQVVEGQDKGARAADAHVGDRVVKGFLWRLHDPRCLRRKQDKEDGENKGDEPKENDRGTDHPAALLLPLLADQLSQLNRGTHGKTCKDVGDGLHDLRAGGDTGDIRRVTELPHHHQIHSSVHGLQKQSKQHRERKQKQRLQNLPLCEISGF